MPRTNASEAAPPFPRSSSRDVARLAGVSQATVSYVLNERKDQSISPQTRARVLAAVEQLGYRSSAPARALKTGKTEMVSVWVPYLGNPVFASVIQEVENLARQALHQVLVAQISGGVGTDRRVLAGLGVDGVVAHDSCVFVDQLLASNRLRVPVVTTGPAYSSQTDHVGVNLYGGARAGVRHLIESGRREIAQLAYAPGCAPGDARYDAFLHALTEAGLSPLTIPVAAYNRALARQAVTAAVGEGLRFDALFCWNDELAVGASRGLHDAGVRIPDDVAVLGLDGIAEMEYHHPALSTVAQPISRMCALAWEFLRRRMEDPTLPPQQVILPMELVPRASTLG